MKHCFPSLPCGRCRDLIDGESSNRPSGRSFVPDLRVTLAQHFSRPVKDGKIRGEVVASLFAAVELDC